MMSCVIKSTIHCSPTAQTCVAEERLAIQVVVRCQMACTADDPKILKPTLPTRNGLIPTLVQLIHTPAKVGRDHPLLAPHLVEHPSSALIHPLAPTHSRATPRAAQHCLGWIYSNGRVRRKWLWCFKGYSRAGKTQRRQHHPAQSRPNGDRRRTWSHTRKDARTRLCPPR